MQQKIILFCIILFCAHSVLAQQSLPTLKSHAVMVLDTQNNNVIYDKNANNVMPIASIAKLMTAMVVLDAGLPLNEKIAIDSADVDRLKNTRSRLPVGTSYARHELLRLSLMSSENRAAAALGRAYPGGTVAFVNDMNKKAMALGMVNSYFVEPTGLSSANVSTAQDLAKMVAASNDYGVIREFSTTSQHVVSPHNKSSKIQYVNSNSLVGSQNWEIGVSKTGYLNEAGRCLVMQANINGKPVVIVLLNSWGKNTRIGDANRVRKWMENIYARKQI